MMMGVFSLMRVTTPFSVRPLPLLGAAALAAPDLPAQWLLLGAVMLAGLAVSLMREEPVGRMDTFRPVWWRGAVLAVLTAWSVLSFTGITGFIYSNF